MVESGSKPKNGWNAPKGHSATKAERCLNSHIGLCEIEYQAAKKWLKSHKRACPIKSEEKYYFIFTPNGIAFSVAVVCENCGKEKDISHIDHW